VVLYDTHNLAYVDFQAQREFDVPPPQLLPTWEGTYTHRWTTTALTSPACSTVFASSSSTFAGNVV